MSEYNFGEDIDVRDHRSQEWTTVSFITETEGDCVLCCTTGKQQYLPKFEVERWILHRKPLPKLRKDDPVYVNDGVEGPVRRHFSHFDSEGLIHTYINGKTSWTISETCSWDKWRLPTAEELR